MNTPLLTEPEAAALLSMSPLTLKAVRLGKVPTSRLMSLRHVKLGRAVRYRREDVQAWIEANLHGAGEK